MNRRPRPLIALVMPWQFGPGGAQRYVVDLALWASRFAQVHIVYHGSDDPTWQAICRPAGIALNACNGPAGIEQLLRALQPDLIHHHYPAQTQAIAGLIGKVPLVGTSHGWDANHELPTWGVPIVGDFPNVIRTGVDLDRYHPNAEAEKRGKQPFRVGIVGCMGFEKYPFDFLKSLAGWKPENVALYCFGRGGFHNGRKIIEDALTAMNWPVLVGEVPPEKMPGVYRQIDALLIPSDSECCPYVVLEAMASGVPVIGRAVGGLPWTLCDDALLGKTDADLFAAVERLRDDPKLCRKLGKRGRQRAERLHDIRTMMKKYGTVYAERTDGLVQPNDPDLDVTVAMPIGDGCKAEYFRAAVKSVLRQQGVKFKLLVISDGVTDPELHSVISSLEDHDQVRILESKVHQGLGIVLNLAVREARTELIARADGDDVMPDGRLADQVRIMRQNPNLALLCGDMAVIREDGSTKTLGSNPYLPSKPLWTYWNGQWPIAHPTVMFRRYAVLKAGNYDPALPYAEDYDLWCKLEVAGFQISKVNRIWNHYRMHPGQVGRRPGMSKFPEQITAKYAHLFSTKPTRWGVQS